MSHRYIITREWKWDGINVMLLTITLELSCSVVQLRWKDSGLLCWEIEIAEGTATCTKQGRMLSMEIFAN